MNFELELDIIKDWIMEVIKEAEIQESEFEFVDICAYGSRTCGKASVNSDLDILLEYKGSAREDHIFNILHEEGFMLEGTVVDVNPIKADDSGTIKEYLARCDNNWKEQLSHRARGR